MREGPKSVKIAPIVKGVFGDLSYFSLKNIKKGDLVSVELRKKQVPAAVVQVEKVIQIKSKLRKSPFSLKRISDTKAREFFTPNFLDAAGETAEYFVSGTGNIIKELCPGAVLDNPPTEIETAPRSDKKGKRSVLVLQTSQKERIKFYKNLIRGEFAENHSVFLCLPSPLMVEKYEEKIKKGIEKFTFALHSRLPKKTLKKNWENALKESHPVLIISTGSFLSLPRKDINYFILEKEGSPLYKSQNRPFLNIKTAIEKLARHTKSSLVLADEIIRTETYGKKIENKIMSAMPISQKIISNTEQILVNTRGQNTPISPELKKMIESTFGKNERTILFLNRRGYGSSTICNDCGHIVTCDLCDTPVVLHKESTNVFVCHKCLSKTPARSACPHCKGWNLKTLGWGIERAEEELSLLFPQAKIFRLDGGSAKTKKQAEQILENYLSSPGSILLATEILFSHFEGGADRIGVISVDGLFNMPDFRINEKIFRLLLRLRMRSKKTFLVQTRMEDRPIFKYVFEGDLTRFYDSELGFRKALGYPPFKTLIKIRLEGKSKEETLQKIKELEKELEPWNPILFPAFTSKIKNLHRFYILLRLTPGTWPKKQEELHTILSSLLPMWKIDVDPESLL